MKKLFLFGTFTLIMSLNSNADSSVKFTEKKEKMTENYVTCTYVTGNVSTTRGTCAAARSAHIRKLKTVD